MLLGRLVAASGKRNEILIATKFSPGKRPNLPVREAMLKAARESLKRLGVDRIDLYQIHAPKHRSSFEEQGYGLADIVDAGLARA